MEKSFKDKDILEKQKDSLFIKQCIDEFGDKPLPTTNRSKVKNLTTWSYFPNVISIVTACFFIFYLLQDYSPIIKIVLCGLLCGVAIALEFGKRSLINETAKTYFVDGKLKVGLLLGVLVLIGASMTASYIGGNKLVVENAEQPIKLTNPKIDSLNLELATLNKSISKQEGTTWKGKVTRDANKNLNQLYADRTALNSRISALEDQDEEIYTTTLSTHSAKIGNFGIVLGIIAILADAVLFTLIWTIKRLRHEIILLTNAKATTQEKVTKAANLSNAQNITTIGNSFSKNQLTEKRKIGFVMPTQNRNRKEPSPTDKPDTESRITESRKEETQNRNTETIIEREIIELSDRIKECAHCGNKFVYYNSRAKYCSDQCRISAWQIRTGKKLKIKTK
ncbi:MAG: hypothetical protein MRY78_10620 [Saprospiraceae bacterium]|nr:hypothetical protein [Saprospiraceae bacterium]